MVFKQMQRVSPAARVLRVGRLADRWDRDRCFIHPGLVMAAGDRCKAEGWFIAPYSSSFLRVCGFYFIRGERRIYGLLL